MPKGFARGKNSYRRTDRFIEETIGQSERGYYSKFSVKYKETIVT